MTVFKSLIVMTTVAFGSMAAADTLTLRVETKTASGMLRAAVFDSQEAFDANETIAVGMGPAVEGVTEVRVENLKAGTYGIAIFHDLNGNEVLDRNLMGAPNEPFGFSTNPQIQFSAPSFDDFMFEFAGEQAEINIMLNGG